MKGSAKPVKLVSVVNGRAQAIEAEVVTEGLSCISVNGVEMATWMCSPNDLDLMALGFLANEGIISSLADVRDVHVSRQKSCVDVWLQDAAYTPPTRAIVTAGCGGGITFDDLSEQYEPLPSTLSADPALLAELMRGMHQGAAVYQRARGIHTAALADAGGIWLQVEDIGRHNCLDKLRGAALKAGRPTADNILLSSGRISSEMITKARRMGTPIVCSRTSPTSLSVALAEAWGIAIVAYLRQDRMRLYTHPARVLAQAAV